MPYKGKTIALVLLTPSQVLEDQKFLQSEHERRALDKERVLKKKSEPKRSEQEKVSEAHSERKQERECKHPIKGEERKESQKKISSIEKVRVFLLPSFLFCRKL